MTRGTALDPVPDKERSACSLVGIGRQGWPATMAAMNTPSASLVLRRAGGRGLIVAADFAVTGRSTATFHDLVDLLGAEYDIWETAPVPYGEEAGMTGEDQVDRWIRDIEGSGLPVHAVIGFCGGCVYAGRLAERIGRWQPVPRLILLDPGLVVPTMMVDHVAGVVRRLSGTFAPDDLAAAEQRLAALLAAPGGPAASATPAAPGGPLALADALAGYAREVIGPALERGAHSPDAGAGWVRLVTAYLYWLAGAAMLNPRQIWKSATALQSCSPNFGLFLADPQERPTLVGSAEYFDVPHTDLMRTPDVAKAVDTLLA